MQGELSAQSGLVTVEEMAGYLQVPASWLYARTASNAIPHVRVGRYVRFNVSEVMAWLAESGR